MSPLGRSCNWSTNKRIAEHLKRHFDIISCGIAVIVRAEGHD